MWGGGGAVGTSEAARICGGLGALWGLVRQHYVWGGGGTVGTTEAARMGGVVGWGGVCVCVCARALPKRAPAWSGLAAAVLCHHNTIQDPRSTRLDYLRPKIHEARLLEIQDPPGWVN